MRRLFSLQTARAPFGTLPRMLIVGAVLAGLIFLGSVWLDRDIMRHAEDDSAADE